MLLLAPLIYGTPGGIQRCLKMLCDLLAETDPHFIAISLHDRADDVTVPPSFRLTRCAGRKTRFCREALRLSWKNKPRTVIVGHAGFLPLAWILRRLGLIERYVLMIYGLEAWRELPRLSRRAAREAAITVAPTHYTAEEFCFHNRVDAQRCVVIPLACCFSAPPVRDRTIGSVLRLLTVGRLCSAEGYKGIDTVLHAMSQCPVRMTFEIIGEGDDRQRLEDLARQLGVRESVRFRGAVPDVELQSAFLESDLFVMPSRKEGFGFVYVEAMTAGLPCIGANHGGAPEVIEHGETGFLIEYGDAGRLSFYLSAIAASPELYRNLSQAAHRRATAMFTRDTLAKAWRELLASDAPRPSAKA